MIAIKETRRTESIESSAQMLLPEFVADDRDSRRAGAIFGRDKVAAQRRLQADDVEKIGAQESGRTVLRGRAVLQAKSDTASGGRADAAENLAAALAPLSQFVRREVSFVLCAPGPPESP